MKAYLIINILIIAVPVLFSFENSIKFYKKLPYLFLSILIVGFFYILWDSFAADRGDWSFNENYLSGINIFNLPLEEILFFISVPYSIIFLFETAKFYFSKRLLNVLPYKKSFYNLVSILLVAVAFVFLKQDYTFIVLVSTALFIFLANIFSPQLLKSKLYWFFMLFSFVPFLIVNYFLTSLPIITYNPEAIWGIRLITIPAEDLFYSFSMVSFYLLVYKYLSERR